MQSLSSMPKGAEVMLNSKNINPVALAVAEYVCLKASVSQSVSQLLYSVIKKFC